MRSRFQWVGLLFTLLILLLACNLSTPSSFPIVTATHGIQSVASSTNTAPPSAPQATATSTATATPVFSGAIPGEPPGSGYTVTDNTEKATGGVNYAAAGDNYANNLFERPFTNDLTYRPDLDIQGGTISKDTAWLFTHIQLAGQNSADRQLDANYGVELDVNMDGRGEYVIWVLPPYTTQWSRGNTTIYGTTTNQVGGPHPILSDAPWNGSTYDKIVFNGASNFTSNGAWVRISPVAADSIDIAFNPQIIGDPAKFLWGLWADDGIKDPSKFDYNDTYTRAQAGVLLAADSDYPPKEIFAVDNTCRSSFGFNLVNQIPGSCSLLPTATPKPKNTLRGIVVKVKASDTPAGPG